MRIAVGANSRGLAVRAQVIPLLQRLGHEVDVVDAPQGQATEYPEVAAALAQRMAQGGAEKGILIGRSGMGMCIVANKFPGVRAAVCNDEFTADTSRRYLDVNVLCLSADMVGEYRLLDCGDGFRPERYTPVDSSLRAPEPGPAGL